MGTKNSPGNFDCYSNADGDEPMFVLLGRDKFAASLVRMWALAHHPDKPGGSHKKMAELNAAQEAALNECAP